MLILWKIFKIYPAIFQLWLFKVSFECIKRKIKKKIILAFNLIIFSWKFKQNFYDFYKNYCEILILCKIIKIHLAIFQLWPSKLNFECLKCKIFLKKCTFFHFNEFF